MPQLNPLNARPVRVVDSSGNVIDSFGGGGGGGTPTYDAANLTPVGVSVTGALTELAAADANRLEAWFTNCDAGLIWVSDDGDATVRGAGCTPVPQYSTFFAAAPKSRITAIKDTGSIDCFVTGQVAV